MCVGVRLGNGLGGCGGVLGMGLGRLAGWKGHFDGMTAGGDRESWKVGVIERVTKSSNGIRFGLEGRLFVDVRVAWVSGRSPIMGAEF